MCVGGVWVGVWGCEYLYLSVCECVCVGKRCERKIHPQLGDNARWLHPQTKS